MDYQEFLKQKIKSGKYFGFDIDESEINPMLFPHQKDIVRWCIKGGRRAIFASFGLGKSFMQLEILRLIQKHKSGNQLIIAPLGVIQEFKVDAEKLGININFIRKTEQVTAPGLYITNYESVREEKLDINLFNGVSLDEASVLRSYGSKTFQTFLTLFDTIPYRFVATATPSPNRFKELIHYSGFLGIMDSGQALTRFFQRDSTKANNLTLYPHKEEEFWLWMHGWAIFLQKPSDLGYSDLGYDLPKLNVHWHCINHRSSFAVDRKTKQVEMFFDPSMSLAGASKEKRESIDIRIEKMKEIIDSEPDNHFIIWHDQEEERHRIKKQVPSCKEVYGSLDLETREQRVIDFSNGKFQYIATKPILSGSGVNWQRHCHNAIYLGIGFKFNDFIQSIHRIYRFQQDKECNIHIIYTSNEKNIVKVLKEKWTNHNRMVENMAELIKKHGLSHIDMASELSRSMGVERIEVTGKNFIIANNDCVEEVKLIKDNSMGLIVTSIPFSNHYEYTPSFNDFGHTENNDHFWKQMDYLTPELLRVLIPGRIYACHVKDRILFGNVTGAGLPTVSPFHMEATFHAMKHGFDYCGMITVSTDVVRENNQTYRLGWTEQCKDGSKMGVGSPEYVLLFHKPQTDRTRGYSDVPVKKEKTKKHTCPNCNHILKKGENITTEEKESSFFLDGQAPKWLCNNCNTYQHFMVESEYSRSRWQIDAHQYWRSSGDRLVDIEELSSLTPDIISKVYKKYDLENIYDYETHVKIGENLDLKGCLPSSFMSLAPNSKDPMIWTDINRMLTLNGSQSRKGLALHVCPLQTDIVDRLITRYSNKNEWVYDPFGGLGSVPVRAVKLGRKGRSSELNPNYFLDSVKYMQAAEISHKTPSLFDFIEAQIKED